jgi:hypothetical protein
MLSWGSVKASSSSRASSWLVPVASLALAACGGSTSSIGGSDGGADGGGTFEAGGPSPAEIATDAAHAYCTRAQTCASFYVSVAFGDVATCESRLQAQLVSELSAPSVTETTAQLEACAAALPEVACSDLLGRATIPACPTLAGKLADGAACAFDGQCAGTRCHAPSGATCGTCGTPAPSGSGCQADDDCDSAMKCVNGACAPYGGPGAACSATQPCRPDLGCVGGTCGTPSVMGTACTDSTACDQLHAGFCDPLSKVCATATIAQAGSPCGLVAGQFVLCQGPGSFCRGDQAPTYQGTCVAFAPDGASCDADAGPLCDYGAVCESGTCQVPSATRCK